MSVKAEGAQEVGFYPAPDSAAPQDIARDGKAEGGSLNVALLEGGSGEGAKHVKGIIAVRMKGAPSPKHYSVDLEVD